MGKVSSGHDDNVLKLIVLVGAQICTKNQQTVWIVLYKGDGLGQCENSNFKFSL